MLSKYIVCDFGSNKSKFIKQEEPYELMNSLGIRNNFSESSRVGNILFSRYNRKKIENKFLLVGDKSMSKIHLRQRGFM